jgi:hypothetical protein
VWPAPRRLRTDSEIRIGRGRSDGFSGCDESRDPVRGVPVAPDLSGICPEVDAAATFLRRPTSSETRNRRGRATLPGAEFPGGTGDGSCRDAGAEATCFRAPTSSETRNRRVREVLPSGVTLGCVGADVGRAGGMDDAGWDDIGGWGGGAVTTCLRPPTSSETRNRRARRNLNSPREAPCSGGASAPSASSSALVGIRCLAFCGFTATAPGLGAPDPQRQPCKPIAAG